MLKTLTILIVINSYIYAGMAVYIIKDKKGNTISYKTLVSNQNGYKTSRNLLQQIKGYLEETGYRHSRIDSGNLIEGYFTIVSNGKRFSKFPAYGVGYSDVSLDDSRIKALKSLGTRDWSWYDKKHGHKVERSGTFPYSQCSNRFNKCLKKATTLQEKKKCAMDKKECSGTKTDKKKIDFKQISDGVRG